MALAGAAGGLAAFLIMDPGLRREELSERVSGLADAETVLGTVFAHALVLGIVVGVAIGTALILAEELEAPNLRRLLRRVLFGAAVGLLFGAVGGILGQVFFAVLSLAAVVARQAGLGAAALWVLTVARTVGWALMGASAGLCPGGAALSGRRMRQGALGGLAGGALGGLLFDPIGAVTGTGTTSRLVGFVVLGAAIGAAASLVEELAKQYLADRPLRNARRAGIHPQ